MKYEVYFKTELAAIEDTLKKVLPPSEQFPPMIHEAMRYSVFPGGKRFRPVLALSACVACGGKIEDALIPAASVELIHCYSLVHDDLPALDNDDERRGKPSCHKEFGEGEAILAGDGLLTLSFQILAHVQPASQAAALLSEISTASGTYGMIGGQVAEMKLTEEQRTLPALDYISSHKTGKLIKAASVAGAIVAGASKEDQKRLAKFGESLGLAFQFIDDLMDGDGYLNLIKAKDIRQKVRDLIAKAKRSIHPLGQKAENLQTMADYLLRRMPEGNHVALDR